MKQSKAGPRNLNQDLFFSHFCFWPYISFLSKGLLVTLHSNSELLFSLLYQHHQKIWRPRALPMCMWQSIVWYMAIALHTCVCRERETKLRRCGQSEIVWVKSWVMGLALVSMWQLWGMVQCPGERLPRAVSLLPSRLNSYVKLVYFPTSIKQSNDTKTGTFLLFAHLLLQFTLYYELSHIKNSSQKELLPKGQFLKTLKGLHWQCIQPVL